MAAILKELKGGVQYRDRRFDGDAEAYKQALQTTKTVYIGNLAFYTREEQLYETRKPCGFAFVLFVSHDAATAACSYISGTKLDNRYIRVDLDWGFQEGRQYGRGKAGGQVRDEFALGYDAGRLDLGMNQVYMSGMDGKNRVAVGSKRGRSD